MKHVKLFENYNQIHTEVFDYNGFEKLIYSTTENQSVFDRIRFLSRREFSYWDLEKETYYIVLFENSKIIGVAKIGYYPIDSNHEKDFSIPFFSIDKEYRNQGYSHVLADKLFETAKEKGLDIRTSTYTYVGYLKLKPLFNKYADKHGVIFTDKDDSDLIDYKHMYDDDLNHKNEI